MIILNFGAISAGAMEIDQDFEPAHKRQRLEEAKGGESVDSDGKFS